MINKVVLISLCGLLSVHYSHGDSNRFFPETFVRHPDKVDVTYYFDPTPVPRVFQGQAQRFGYGGAISNTFHKSNVNNFVSFSQPNDPKLSGHFYYKPLPPQPPVRYQKVPGKAAPLPRDVNSLTDQNSEIELVDQNQPEVEQPTTEVPLVEEAVPNTESPVVVPETEAPAVILRPDQVPVIKNPAEKPVIVMKDGVPTVMKSQKIPTVVMMDGVPTMMMKDAVPTTVMEDGVPTIVMKPVEDVEKPVMVMKVMKDGVPTVVKTQKIPTVVMMDGVPTMVMKDAVPTMVMKDGLPTIVMKPVEDIRQISSLEDDPLNDEFVPEIDEDSPFVPESSPEEDFDNEEPLEPFNPENEDEILNGTENPLDNELPLLPESEVIFLDEFAPSQDAPQKPVVTTLPPPEETFDDSTTTEAPVTVIPSAEETTMLPVNEPMVPKIFFRYF